MSTSASISRSMDGQKDASPKLNHKILLVDHTKPAGDSASTPDSPNTSDTRLSKKWTHASSIRDMRSRRKYAKWNEDKGTSEATDIPETESSAAKEDIEGNDQGAGSDTGSRLKRGRQKIKGILNPKKAAASAKDENTVIDALYENQRGSFFCGIPLFSSNTLLNFDPPAWVDSRFKPSPVNITNAQVPDPSWIWEWKSWYVDMSRDVDEEGWEYSFMFQNRFAWHGTHPWFHSFVRRRRWLRKRVRTHIRHVHGQDSRQRKSNQAHILDVEYFTIHPSRNRSPSSSRSRPTSSHMSKRNSRLSGQDDEPEPLDDIRDIPALMRRLKNSAIDREKLVAIQSFVKNANDELFYLADQIPVITSLFTYQESRRHLLSILTAQFDAATRHRKKHEEREEEEDAIERKRIDNLLRAVEAADDEAKKLEYWSDIRGMVRKGEVAGAADEDHGWHHGWQGVDNSAPGAIEVNAPTSGFEDDDEEFDPRPKDKGKARQD
ncbi:hypothetical protein M501DRAFT_1015223 [Patellaria atrata CBS 101060]|uniref:Peroxin/Ferlin domain-containing protein n=1 Tax=Patellaria atrata CBS 101060 TaxID=1346257 RepID=A0A9P4VNU1_9PEZI|nr:hypothetical protein M501DRAFT_1015223 [Patellaria atrata CBS 101060]